MADALSELTESLNSTARGMRREGDLRESIARMEVALAAHMANTIAYQRQMIVDNKAFIGNIGTELRKTIDDENRKTELLRADIKAYTEGNNRLLNEVKEYLKEISERVSKPVLIPPPLEIPNEMLKKMDKMIELLEKTHGELEGLDFRTGQKTISKDNTPERMAHKFRSKSMLVTAEKTNSDVLYMGSEGVGPSTGTKLNAGESIQLDSNQATREIWLYGTKGDAVNFVALSYKPETMKGGSR